MNRYVMPLGLDSFEEIRNHSYYYIDKTDLIVELLKKVFKVQLFTRPRRFGKTLMMDTLASFFDIRKNTKNLFAGLSISCHEDLCEKWQNQWPVLFLTLKDVDDKSFENAKKKLDMIISKMYREHVYLLESDKLYASDREIFEKYLYQKADEIDLQNALYSLMSMMQIYYGKPVIVLIDEYDVPLAKANEKGYYDDMLNVVRGLMSITLKSNPFLKFAVVTGCLKISKESVFTGVNNLVSDTITGERFCKYFGFTSEEVSRLLQDIGAQNQMEVIRNWYDGYHFGSADIYCPWDVLNHINAIQDFPDAVPGNYWEDTSHNGILRNIIELSNSRERQDLAVNDKFEILLNGSYIEEAIDENLTYDSLYTSETNLWSLLYLTGYLTRVPVRELRSGMEGEEGKIFLKIPNEEVRDIFRKTVVEWFRERIAKVDRSELFDALWGGESKKATESISNLLFSTISYHDYREDFYHAFLAGIFTGAGYNVESNREHGMGRTDLVIRDRNQCRVMIIEAKRADAESGLQAECRNALQQIDDKRYTAEFTKGYKSVISYGIAFFGKKCLVMKSENCVKPLH